MEHRSSVVVDPMPHLWMPAVLPVISGASVPYVELAHDADVHFGDRRMPLAKRPMGHCVGKADALAASHVEES